MNVVLIGGTGNLSTDCASELLSRGHSVSAVTRGNSPTLDGVTPIKADRSQPGALKRALSGIDCSCVIDFICFRPEDAEMDIEALRGQARQLIFISSATVYRKPHSQLPITESHPLGNPFSKYAQNKLACEEYLAQQQDVPVTIVRPSHTYSKRWAPNAVSSAGYTFIDRLERGLPVYVPGSGDNPWTLTATTDFAKGLCGLVGLKQAFGEIYNVTSDEHRTWKEIYRLTAELAGTPPPEIVEIPVDFLCGTFPRLIDNIRGDKSEPAIFDNSKIHQAVPDFVCSKPMKEGLSEAIAWMRTHPEDKVIKDAVHKTFDEVITAWRKHVDS